MVPCCNIFGIRSNENTVVGMKGSYINALDKYLSLFHSTLFSCIPSTERALQNQTVQTVMSLFILMKLSSNYIKSCKDIGNSVKANHILGFA